MTRMDNAIFGRRVTEFSPPEPEPNVGSYELKFLLPDAAVEPVIEWARRNLSADPHAETPDGDTYRIHSVYFDTDHFDVYHQTKGYRKNKYRIRRYGCEPLLYLERKRKERGWVRKQRTAVPEADIAVLALPEPDAAWEGEWFRHRLERSGLKPQCEIAYRRLARVGEADGGPIRLTVDREFRCAPTMDRVPTVLDERRSASLDRAILELKFGLGLPRVFKDLIREFELSPDPASKYRQAIQLCGVADDRILSGRTAAR